MKNKVFCSAFGISADGNKIWGSAHDFNEIYEADLLSHKMRSLGRLEGEEDYTNLVEYIEYCPDKVVFVPGSNGRYFHVFDLKTAKQTKFPKNKFASKSVKNDVNRFFSFAWNQKVYVICRDQLCLYSYHSDKDDFEIVFEEDGNTPFKCMAFSVWDGFVAFLSIELNEIVIYNLSENDVERIKLDKKMMGINRIAITQNRIFLYRIEDRMVYLLDRKGTLLKEFSVLAKTQSNIMMFHTEENAYLIGITKQAKDIFKIDPNGAVEQLCWEHGEDLNVYCLNRINDILYGYELASSKNVTGLYYDAKRCFQYKLGTNAVHSIEWDTDEIAYEDKLIKMLKEGALLFENSVYNLEFAFQHINSKQDYINESHANVGNRIYNQLKK